MSTRMGWTHLLSVLSFTLAGVADGLSEQRGKTKFPRTFGESAIRRIIEDNGYGYENYTVTTDDGNLLNLNRIVHPNRTGSDRGYPLLLVNGILVQSETWLVQPKLDHNLGFVFADNGYDVWLGDQRGSMRSKGHVNRTIDKSKLWDFSYHESGIYDLPAFIDFILDKTSHKDLIYTCMSLGCTFHTVLGSKRPSYNQKVRAAVYIVPVVNNVRRIEQLTIPVYMLYKLIPILMPILEEAGMIEWFPNMENLKKLLYLACRAVGPVPYWLLMRLLFGSGFHIQYPNVCDAVVSLGGGNPKTTSHIHQVFHKGDLAEYNFGREENMKRYGTEQPPLYDMSKITSPIAFYYSDVDSFTDSEGLQRTIKSLGGSSYTCELPNFHHLDVAVGTTARFVLPDMIDLLNSISGKSNDTEKFKSGKCPSMEWIRHLQ
uniref:Lipase n=1 Tax=Lygus hesperus TaxID=30085 RepID=A0A0A9WV98_LYGHE